VQRIPRVSGSSEEVATRLCQRDGAEVIRILEGVSSDPVETFQGVTGVAYGVLGWALVLAGGSVTLVLAVRGRPLAYMIGFGTIVVGWVAWRLTTSKVTVDAVQRTVVVRQPWRTKTVGVDEIARARVTEPRLQLGSALSYPRRYVAVLVLDLQNGRHVRPFALRRVGGKQPGSYLGDPANVRAAAAVNALLPPLDPPRLA